MKAKPSERVPYRRGVPEESALARLSQLRSRHVPLLGSDNLWLRFAVRLLAELCQLAGKQALLFQLGEPGGANTALRVLGAPPTQLSAGTGEVRLRAGEAALLDQLRSTLGHSSRSATLRHALFACQQLCEGLAHGEKIWLERQGGIHVLPSLLDIAASMEQGAAGTVQLLGSQLAPLSPPVAAAQTAAATAVLCNAGELAARDRIRLCGEGPVEYVSANALLERLGVNALCIQAAAPQAESSEPSAGEIRVVLQAGREPRAERVERPVPSNVRPIGLRVPPPARGGDGLREMNALQAARRRPGFGR